MKISLYEALTDMFAGERPVSSVPASEHEVYSIISNLDRLFNSRRGIYEHIPDYGLPDISEVYRDMPDSVVVLQKAIVDAVEKYEPRLRRVRIQKSAQEEKIGRLEFVLSGELADRSRIHFQTTFASHEMVNVRRLKQV